MKNSVKYKKNVCGFTEPHWTWLGTKRAFRLANRRFGSIRDVWRNLTRAYEHVPETLISAQSSKCQKCAAIRVLEHTRSCIQRRFSRISTPRPNARLLVHSTRSVVHDAQRVRRNIRRGLSQHPNDQTYKRTPIQRYERRGSRYRTENMTRRKTSHTQQAIKRRNGTKATVNQATPYIQANWCSTPVISSVFPTATSSTTCLERFLPSRVADIKQ